MQDTSYHHPEIMHDRGQSARRTKFFGYLAASFIIGTVLWGAAFLMPITKQGMNPITMASQAIGYEQQIEDPMLVARESHLRLIEPAAGPTSKD